MAQLRKALLRLALSVSSRYVLGRPLHASNRGSMSLILPMSVSRESFYIGLLKNTHPPSNLPEPG
jgi:hypothetical protein